MTFSPPQPGLWAPYIGPAATVIAVFVSASITIAIALSQLATTRSIARMRATLDLIEKAESSEHYIKITATFSDVRRTNAFLALVDPIAKDRPKRFAVLGYLNHYETIALFIRKRVLDELTYKDWIVGTLVRDWNAATGFIQRERWGWDGDKWVYDPTLLKELQALACRWSRDAVRLDAGHSGPPPGLPGPEDDLLPTLDPDDAVEPEPISDDAVPAKSVDKPNR